MFGSGAPARGTAGACGGCRSGPGHRYALAARGPEPPVGVVRRVAPNGASTPPEDPPVDEDRRRFLKLAAIGGAIALGAGGAAVAFEHFFPTSGAASYPKVQLYYDDGTPILASQYRYAPSEIDLILFNYPLTNEPNMLLNLGASVENGVGPQQNLVAFSAICQHQGCLPPEISYYPAGSCGSFYGGKALIHCVCHGSTYDPAQGASLITGPALVALPQVTLQWDATSDALYAVGVTGPPVFGHTNTLQGGTPVASPTQTGSPMTPSQQCPT